MHQPSRHLRARGWLPAGVIAALVLVAFTLVSLAAAAGQSDVAAARCRSALKLPAERTSPSGNFFYLEGCSVSKTVANFEMKVCTSAHTPADTAIDPALFTVSLSGGGVVSESVAAAKSPAIVLKPMKPLECVEGWLGFDLPSGKVAAVLEYDYKGVISWKVG